MFMALNWEGQDLSEVRIGDGGDNAVHGFPGEYIVEEKKASFDAIHSSYHGWRQY